MSCPRHTALYVTVMFPKSGWEGGLSFIFVCCLSSFKSNGKFLSTYRQRWSFISQGLSGLKTLLLAAGCLTILGGLLAIALLEVMKNEEKRNNPVTENSTDRPAQHADRFKHMKECRWGPHPCRNHQAFFLGKLNLQQNKVDCQHKGNCSSLIRPLHRTTLTNTIRMFLYCL